jgi:outer membrane protein, heavy metal efflux system
MILGRTVCCWLFFPALLGAQTPVTMATAVDSALARGTRVALARADSATARAQLIAARELPNPTASINWTEDTPHMHGFVFFPIDYPWYRRARMRGAELGARSAGYRYAFERAAARFDAETTYVRALAAVAHGRISRTNAVVADSLRRLAIVRRDAGDASDLDVELAAINAGQVENIAASDSLVAIAAVLNVQFVMGLGADQVTIALTDSLAPTLLPVSDSGRAKSDSTGGAKSDSTRRAKSGLTLQVAAASEALSSQDQALLLAKRAAWAQPQVSVGVEGGDPLQKHVLPAAGLSLPFPLFNSNGGATTLEAANVDRARAQLAVARRESDAAIAESRRAYSAALARAARDRTLLTSADRVARLSLTAFAEGAEALPAVLEAQRSARDALSQYVDDVAATNAASAAVRLFTSTVDQP